MKLKLDGLTGETLEFAVKLNTMLENVPEGLSKEQVENIIREETGKYAEILGEFDASKPGTVKAALVEQGNKINELLEQIGKGLGGSTTWEDFKKELDSPTIQDQLKENKKKKSGNVTFTMKVAGPETRTGGVTNSSTSLTNQLVGNENAPVYTIRRGKPFILEFVTVGQTDAPALVWFDEVPRTGDFAVTAEGATKVLIEYVFNRTSTDYRKAAGRVIITEEFDKDYPRLVSTIKQLMNIDCLNEMNALILTDMISQASPFAYTGLNGAISNPDDYAAIGAAICQLQSFFYEPNVLVINPADAWAMRLTKDLQGRYQMSPLTGADGKTYEFGAIITDPRVAIGYAFVGDGSIYNVDLRGELIVRMGYSTGDFEANQYTLLVEQYFFNHISQAKKPGFIYFNFGTVKAAIAAA
jgi:hypothetical protein